ncbi:MAG TPA: gliding motility-associated protein GldE [Bacteroidaceae bacterium]|nr:gliding motility-associated protein GldE [Bacteroidaceae bacterium]
MFQGISVSNPTAGAIIALIIALLLIFISGFVSASEMAFFSLSPVDLKEIERKQSNNDAKVLKLLGDSERLLATVLIANNLVNVSIILLCNIFFTQIFDFGTSKWVEFLIITVLLTFILLLFGEITPKLYSSNNSLKFSRKSASVMVVLIKSFRPVSSLLMRSTVIANRIVTKKGYNISVDELEHALELTDVSEIKEEHKMLQGVIRFGDETVADIMTSRLDIIMLDIKANYQEVMKSVAENIYSRIPVYSKTSDNIKGILYIKDLLPHLEKSSNFRWQSLIRPAFFVPETRKIDDLLHDFQTNHIHIAIVVDEFGGTSGLVTLEDIIEEILGEINDEFDDVTLQYRKLGDNRYIFEGKISISDFFNVLGLDESNYSAVSDEADTLAGLLLEVKGDFLKKDEELSYKEMSMKVVEMEKRRISKVLVTVHSSEKTERNAST